MIAVQSVCVSLRERKREEVKYGESVKGASVLRNEDPVKREREREKKKRKERPVEVKTRRREMKTRLGRREEGVK